MALPLDLLLNGPFLMSWLVVLLWIGVIVYAIDMWIGDWPWKK